MNTVIYAVKDSTGKYHKVSYIRKDLIPLQRILKQTGIKCDIIPLPVIDREVWNREFKRRYKSRISNQLEFNV